MAALTALNGPAPRPDVVVVDADRVQRCNWETLSAGTRALTGMSRFRALVSTDDEDPPTGSYRIALYRTDAANDCSPFRRATSRAPARRPNSAPATASSHVA